MEHQIEKARDEWINKFKNKWDVQIQKIVSEKNAATSELARNHTAKIKSLKKDRDQQIKDIQLEFSTNISELKVKVDEKKANIEKKYSHKLSQFLTANLKQPTVYDSICSYILYFRSTIFQEQVVPGSTSSDFPPEELQIITFQDITDLHYVEPYPQSREGFTNGFVVGPFHSQQQATKKEITQNAYTNHLEKKVPFQTGTEKSQSLFDDTKNIYTEPGTAPPSDERHIIYTQRTYPLIASAPPSYETVPLSSNRVD